MSVFKVPSYPGHNTGVKPGQLNNSNEDESGTAPNTKPTIPDTFSSTTSDCEPPERKYITCQHSTVAREAVSGESPHRSVTTLTPVPNAHVYTCPVRQSVKPAYLKDYIVGLLFHRTYTHINSPLKKSMMPVVWWYWVMPPRPSGSQEK